MKSWLPHLAAIAVIIACLALMNWQLERAEFKTDLLADWNSERVSNLADLGSQPNLPQHIRARGRFDDTRQVLLDNQVRSFQTGVHVFTPFIGDQGRIVLVNRGWASWPARTAALPDPKLENLLISIDSEITGVLNQPPDVGLRLGEAEPLNADQWPNIITYFDVDHLKAAFGSELAPFVIQLSPEHPAHLTGDDWTIVTFGPEKHIGYAIQWGLIALVVFIIWLVLSLRYYRKRTSA
ncbi:MAG: SURF1 family protein [Pseudomonadota bacterium]